MFLTDLFEGRSPRPTVLERLAAFAQDPDVYVTFTDVLKVGINPKSKWSDPVGIYTYPVAHIVETGRAPYGGARRFCYVVRGTGRVLDLQAYSAADLQRDLDVIQTTFRSMLLTPHVDDRADPQTVFSHELATRCARYNDSPGETIWEATRWMALHIQDRYPSRAQHMVWNSLIRACGYDAISDAGGLISLNEPVQTVFLHRGALSVIEALPNDLMKPFGERFSQ